MYAGAGTAIGGALTGRSAAIAEVVNAVNTNAKMLRIVGPLSHLAEEYFAMVVRRRYVYDGGYYWAPLCCGYLKLLHLGHDICGRRAMSALNAIASANLR